MNWQFLGNTVQLTKVRRKVFSVLDQIRKYHLTVQIILATIPPKDVRRSAEKSHVLVENVTRNIQQDFENFVDKDEQYNTHLTN